MSPSVFQSFAGLVVELHLPAALGLCSALLLIPPPGIQRLNRVGLSHDYLQDDVPAEGCQGVQVLDKLHSGKHDDIRNRI